MAQDYLTQHRAELMPDAVETITRWVLAAAKRRVAPWQQNGQHRDCEHKENAGKFRDSPASFYRLQMLRAGSPSCQTQSPRMFPLEPAGRQSSASEQVCDIPRALPDSHKMRAAIKRNGPGLGASGPS
jgi:hypothetical protein